jgi:hypothetical protein
MQWEMTKYAIMYTFQWTREGMATLAALNVLVSEINT